MARFSSARFSRFALAGAVVAGLAAGAVIYFLLFAWEPVFRRAIDTLSADSRFQAAHLLWKDASPATLAANPFVSIIVNAGNPSSIDQTSDIQFEFREDELRIGALFGYVPFRYPDDWTIDLNRSNLQPWWGAWRPAVFLGLWLAVICVLVIFWSIIATTLCWVPRLIAFFFDRPIGWRGAFKLAMAAQWTATLVVAMLIISYGWAKIPLARVLGGSGLTGVLPILYLVAAPFRFPKSGPKTARNPFQKRATEDESEKKTSAAQAAEEP